MMGTKTKNILASGLVVLWVGLAAWQWNRMEEPQRVPLTNVTGPVSSGNQAVAAGTGWRVNLGLLTSADIQRESSFTAPRNIFATPRGDGSLPLGLEAAVEIQPDSVSGETVAEQVEVEEPAQYRYLGFLRMGESQQKNKDIAVLSKDDEVMVLKVGDHVDDHVILRAITAESVIVRDTATRVEQTVPLSEAPAETGTEQTLVSSEAAETGVEETVMSSETVEAVSQE